MKNKSRKYNVELDDLKVWFLDNMKELDYDAQTIRNHENFMYKIRNFEIGFMDSKPIVSFTYDEIVVFYKYLGSGSLRSLISYHHMLNNYFSFCKNNGKMDDTIDFMRMINKEALERCVNKAKKDNKYVTESIVDEWVSSLVNDVDKAYVRLLFEGIGNDISEICSLKKEDVDFDNNTIRVVKDGKVLRTVSISDKLTKILRNVCNTDILYLENSYDSRLDMLVGSEYVFRPTLRYLDLKATKKKINSGEYNGEHVSRSTLTGRLHEIKKWGGLDFVTSGTLYRSGVMCRAAKAIGKTANKKEFVDWLTANDDYVESTAYPLYKLYTYMMEKISEEDCELVQV